MRVRKNDRWKRPLFVALTLFLLVASFFALSGENMLPEGLNWSAYSVEEQTFWLPKGSTALVYENVDADSGKVLALRGQKIQFGAFIEKYDGGYIAQYNGTDVEFSSDVVLGEVRYYIPGLGYVSDFFVKCGMLVISADIIWLIFVLAWFSKGEQRREEKRRQELLNLFKFYGEKYDLEDAGIDF